MESSEIPVWPQDQADGPRRMCFLSGEARWYLWLQEGNRHAVTSLRRDLLLLHENGDLQLFRDNVPPAGTYITAFHAGRMIRARVCPNQQIEDSLKGSAKHICAIDVDEGIKVNLPLNQVRLLPPEMKVLPCQAIRIDIGLDCIEQFQWPAQLNNMLTKAIGKALIFVDMKCKRPGSIPTIDANVTIVNPATGQSLSIQKWLIDIFSQHLDLCSLERFKPFPVGMSAELMMNSIPMFQQHVFGLGMQAGMPPNFPLPTPHGLTLSMPTPGVAVMLPPAGSPMSPLVSPHTPSSSYPPISRPTPPGSTISATLMPFSATPPAQPVRPAPPPPLPSLPSEVRSSQQKSSECSSTGPSASSSVIFESDPSLNLSLDSPAVLSDSSVGIDLNDSYRNLTSSSGPNPDAPPFYPNAYPSWPSASQSVKIVEIDEHPPSAASPSREGTGRVGGENARHQDNSSSLSAEAAPFVPKFATIKAANTAITPTPSQSPNEAAKATDVSTTSQSPNKAAGTTVAHSSIISPNLQDEITPTSLLPQNTKPESSSSQFPRGNEVQLKQVLRNWKIGEVVPAFMARVWNPSCFEVNVIDRLSGLLSSLQAEMNEYHKSKKINISSKQQAKDLCGDFCACYDVDEDLWFRVQVNEWFMDDSVIPLKVWAVDYGGYSQVDLSSVQPLATELACTAPVLVTLCSMKNIIPRHEYDIWPETHLNRVKEIMPDDKQLYLRIDGLKSIDDIWPVSVFKDPECSGESINEVLVAEGCAYYVGMEKESCDISVYEDAEDPMAEAYERGGNNYDLDDEDACVAVSGLKITDEIGICWFFQRNGYCYKKFCELRHERLDPDGHTIAKLNIHHDSFEQLNENVLSPGSQIKLTVTRIMTVHHFIATISTKGTNIKSRETLKSVIENLNSTKMKRQLKTFTEFPADGEIVLFKDNTGMFYRGRVICADMTTDDHYKVLNVDTGYKSKIPLKDLRRVDPAFLHHPFQAMECWLADVAPTQNGREWTKTCNVMFAELVKDQKMIATVVRSSPWGLEVNLLNKMGQDIAVLLKEMNIVKSCPRRHLPLYDSGRLPG